MSPSSKPRSSTASRSRATTSSRTSSFSRKSSRKPRGTLSKAMVQADVTRIIEVYHRNGRFDVQVVPKIVERPNNRVDLVFEIREGEKTGVKSIIFVGNHAYSDYRLKEVIKTSTSNFLSFLQTTDVYDHRPHRGRPRSDQAFLPDPRLCRRAGRLGDRRIRSRHQGLHHHLHDRGRRPLSLRQCRGSVEYPRGRSRSAAARFAHASRRHLQRRRGRKDGRRRHCRDHQARISVCDGAPARRPQPAKPPHQRRLRRRRRRARLYRAHQHPRQYAHARLRDPARVRYFRRRPLQSRLDRSRRAAHQESRISSRP